MWTPSNTLSEKIGVWVNERKPASSADVGQLAEDYVQARDSKSPYKSTVSGRSDRHTCEKEGHLSWQCNQKTSKQSNWKMKCLTCGKEGNVAAKCPRNAMFCKPRSRLLCRGGLLVTGRCWWKKLHSPRLPSPLPWAYFTLMSCHSDCLEHLRLSSE